MGRVLDDPETAAARPRPATASVSIIRPPTWTGMIPTTRVCRGIDARKLPGRQIRELSLGVVEVHVQRHRIAVHEDRDRAQIPHDLRGRGERHRRDEHGLSGLEAQGLDREVQRRRAGVHGDGVAPADGLGELLLETPHARTRRQPARAQRRHDLLDFSVGNIGPEKRHAVLLHVHASDHGLLSRNFSAPELRVARPRSARTRPRLRPSLRVGPPPEPRSQASWRRRPGGRKGATRKSLRRSPGTSQRPL